MICKTCGEQIDDASNVCPMCGTPVDKSQASVNNAPAPIPAPNSNQYSSSGAASTHLITAVKKMETSAVIWMIIGIFQIMLGLPELCVGYGITSIAIGVWNIVQSNKEKNNAQYFRNNPGSLISYYENQTAMIIVFLFLNLFFGSIIGVIGSIYELTIQSYVKTHKEEILKGN